VHERSWCVRGFPDVTIAVSPEPIVRIASRFPRKILLAPSGTLRHGTGHPVGGTLDRAVGARDPRRVDHPHLVELVRLAVAATGEAEPPLGLGDGTVPVAHYTDPARLERERERLFRTLPIPLAHAHEVRERGASIVRDLSGVSLVVVRGNDGVVRAFKNACRHRGTRLLREDCREKAFVCPYHGWTYGLDGALLHVPHARSFAGLDVVQHGLVQVRAEERHGLVWVALDAAAPAAAAHLGGIDEELGALSLDTHVVARRVVTEQSGNWKMLMEAFLEGYHLRPLHRNTIYPFFHDARSSAQRVGLHVRHASARRVPRGEVAAADRPLRDQATPAYVIFPCTVLIAHPDWTSHVVVQPLAPDRFLWSHAQLVPAEPATEEARAHFERSFRLIEENVFQREDLFAIAEMQAGLRTGANEVLTFGRLESPALWLHDGIRERFDAP
jgi:phenylpropionate dioxygenase-like ring-hydroxylating dioxygenase large terminal subunit